MNYNGQRTDVLVGKEADSFAKMNTNFASFYDSQLQELRYILLNLNDTENYCVARINSRLPLFSDKPTYYVDMIRPEPIKPIFNDINNPQKGVWGIDVPIQGRDSEEILYLNDDLYNFKSAEDRKNYDMFWLGMNGSKSHLKKIQDFDAYLLDSNFINMAKEQAYTFVFKVSDDDSLLYKNLLESKIKKAFDKYAKLKAEQSPEGGQMS